MEGCHVIIFISQNKNPNFPQTLAATINLHGSRRRFWPPRLHLQRASSGAVSVSHHGSLFSDHHHASAMAATNHLQPPSPLQLQPPLQQLPTPCLTSHHCSTVCTITVNETQKRCDHHLHPCENQNQHHLLAGNHRNSVRNSSEHQRSSSHQRDQSRPPQILTQPPFLQSREQHHLRAPDRRRRTSESKPFSIFSEHHHSRSCISIITNNLTREEDEHAPVCINHCRREIASSSLQQSQIHVPPSNHHSCNLRRKKTTASPRRSSRAITHSQGREKVWEWNPNSGERLSAPRVSLLLDSQTSQLVNTGQLVKVSSQLWSKLQKWLNKRDRIGNWIRIKLLIN